MDLIKLVKGFKFKSLGGALGMREKISRTDLGILKVAFMIAALDGEVTDAEYDAFDLLAKKCRGYTPELAAEALNSAMRSAGYLILLSKRVDDAKLVQAFLAEAKAALPDGFAYLSVEDVRRAVITWIVMGLSDGEYSRRERKCIEALRKLFAELKVMRIKQDEERWLALSTDFRQAYGMQTAVLNGRVELITKDFTARVAELVEQYGDSREAQKELREMISRQ